MTYDPVDLTMSLLHRTPGRRLNNFTATTAPTVNDDEDDHYEVGSRWIDTAAGVAYECVDASAGAAVWTTGGGSGSSDLETLLVDTSVTGATDVDRNDAATHDLTLTGNSTLTPIHSDPPTGEAIDLRLIVRQDGTGGRTLGWGGTITWAGGSAPTMPTGADEAMTVGFLSVDDAATWFGYGGDTDDQTAAQVAFTPAGTIASTNTQAAVEEVATEAASALSAHTGDTSDAHDASAVSIVDAGSYYAGSDVEAALQEIGAGGIGGSGGGRILIADVHSTPLVFDDLLQEDDASDLLYGDL